MATWSEPVILFNTEISSATPVAGDVIDQNDVFDVYAWAITTSGFSGSGNILVELWGSLDRTNFYLVGFTYASVDGTVIVSPFPDVPARYLYVSANQNTGTPTATVQAVVAPGNS